MDDPVITLKWSGNKANVVEQGKPADVTIVCDDSSYPLHKTVLSSCSVYFRELFTSSDETLFFLDPVTPYNFEILVRYIYTGATDVHQSVISSLLESAEYLKIKGLAIPDDGMLSDEEISVDDGVSSDDLAAPDSCFSDHNESSNENSLAEEKKSVRHSKRKVKPNKKLFQTDLYFTDFTNDKDRSQQGVKSKTIQSKTEPISEEPPEKSPPAIVKTPTKKFSRRRDKRLLVLDKLFKEPAKWTPNFLGFKKPKRQKLPDENRTPHKQGKQSQLLTKVISPKVIQPAMLNNINDAMPKSEEEETPFKSPKNEWKKYFHVPKFLEETTCPFLVGPKVEVKYDYDFENQVEQEVVVKEEPLPDFAEVADSPRYSDPETMTLVKEEWDPEPSCIIPEDDHYADTDEIAKEQPEKPTRRKQKLVALKTFQCFICSEAFHTSDELIAHGSCRGETERKIEKRKNRPLVSSKRYLGKCPKCNYLAKTTMEFCDHFMEHLEFKCSFCSAPMASLDALDWHVISNSLNEPYECRLCVFSCDKDGDFVEHIVKHMQNQSFPCVMCSFRAPNRIVWMQHLESHLQINYDTFL